MNQVHYILILMLYFAFAQNGFSKQSLTPNLVQKIVCSRDAIIDKNEFSHSINLTKYNKERFQKFETQYGKCIGTHYIGASTYEVEYEQAIVPIHITTNEQGDISEFNLMKPFIKGDSFPKISKFAETHIGKTQIFLKSNFGVEFQDVHRNEIKLENLNRFILLALTDNTKFQTVFFRRLDERKKLELRAIEQRYKIKNLRNFNDLKLMIYLVVKAIDFPSISILNKIIKDVKTSIAKENGEENNKFLIGIATRDSLRTEDICKLAVISKKSKLMVELLKNERSETEREWKLESSLQSRTNQQATSVNLYVTKDRNEEKCIVLSISNTTSVDERLFMELEDRIIDLALERDSIFLRNSIIDPK